MGCSCLVDDLASSGMGAFMDNNPPDWDSTDINFGKGRPTNSTPCGPCNTNVSCMVTLWPLRVQIHAKETSSNQGKRKPGCGHGLSRPPTAGGWPSKLLAGEGLHYDLHVTPWVFNTWPPWLTVHKETAREHMYCPPLGDICTVFVAYYEYSRLLWHRYRTQRNRGELRKCGTISQGKSPSWLHYPEMK
ncbi:hypothetical protein AAY473_036620, partial [Plecturocebus cupreus]